MFVAKVAYLTVMELPEEFDNLSSTVYEGNDGAYYELEVNNDVVNALVSMGVLDQSEADSLVNEVDYIMIWEPA